MKDPGRGFASLPRSAAVVSLTISAAALAFSMSAVHPLTPLVALAGLWFLALAVRSPYFLLIVFLVFMVGRLAEFFPVLGQFSAGKLLIVGTVGTFALSKILSRDFTLIDTQHSRWFYLLMLAVVASSIASTDRAASFGAFFEGYIKVFLLFILITNVVTSKEQSVGLWLAIAGLDTALALYASVASALGHDPLTGQALVEGTRAGLQGALGDPNDLALVLLMGTPFLLLATIETPGPRRLVFAAMLLVCLAGIVATKSRGGLLGLTAGVGLVFNRYIKSKTLLLGIAVAFLIGIAAVAGISERRSGGAHEQGIDLSAQGRLDAWTAAAHMLVKNPILGVGFERVVDNYFAYAIHPAERKIRTTHNSYLQCAAETGFAGFTPFMVLMYLSFQGARRLGRDADPNSRNLVNVMKRAALPSMVAVAVAAFFLSQAWTYFLYIIHAHTAVNLRLFQLEGSENKP